MSLPRLRKVLSHIRHSSAQDLEVWVNARFEKPHDKPDDWLEPSGLPASDEVLAFPIYDNPHVSILIPVYNEWVVTHRCLWSVLQHTRIPFEVIVADDCSTDQTRNILSKENLEKTKKGVRIINCARGGLVDEAALAELLTSGHVAGAAFDVFSVEPAKENPLFGLPNVVCTPHLGAATTEAQENVALQVAEQMSNYLLDGAVENALNMPSVTAEEAKVMGPWIKLADHLGSFAGQMSDEPIVAINVLYDGVVSGMNLDALNCAVIAGIMKNVNPDVNMVSAPVVAKERGIQISTTNQDKSGTFDGYIKVTVVTAKRERSVAGTVFSDGKPRFIQIKGINIDAEVGAHMLYTTNEDVPGIIGALGKTMGDNDVNIANFTLGRSDAGGEAIALLYVDEPVPAEARAKLAETGLFTQIKPLAFDVV